MKCKPYIKITVEIRTQLKTVKITSNIFAVCSKMKFGGVTVRFPKWVESTPPPRISRRPKSPQLLGLSALQPQYVTELL